MEQLNTVIYLCQGPQHRGAKKKGRVSKQKLLKGCCQRQNVTVFLAILERPEFKTFSLLANHGGRQYFSVFHGPYPWKSTLPALYMFLKQEFYKT